MGVGGRAAPGAGASRGRVGQRTAARLVLAPSGRCWCEVIGSGRGTSASPWSRRVRRVDVGPHGGTAR